MRRQLHSVPLNRTNAGHKSFVLLCQHVLKRVTELMEHGFHLCAKNLLIRRQNENTTFTWTCPYTFLLSAYKKKKRKGELPWYYGKEKSPRGRSSNWVYLPRDEFGCRPCARWATWRESHWARELDSERRPRPSKLFDTLVKRILGVALSNWRQLQDWPLYSEAPVYIVCHLIFLICVIVCGVLFPGYRYPVSTSNVLTISGCWYRISISDHDTDI